MAETVTTRCCIAGGGPAGMMLGFLLARAGVDVVVLEKHKDFSRFERLVFIATFEGNPTRVVALTKGLIDSGIPQSRVEELQKDSKYRIETLLKACGYQQ